jgi:hypothetical protein
LVDYFNLCGKEYLYPDLGYIHPAVWRAWHNGMKSIIARPKVASVWKAEKGTDSYYALPL